MRKSSHHADSLRIALVFVCSIALLLAAGIFLKLFLILRSSTFDGSHQYNLSVQESKDKNAILSFNPAAKSVTMLTVIGKVDTTANSYLGIPVDASLVLPLNTDAAKLTENALFHATKEKDITLIDKLRLLLFVNTLKPSDFHYQTITLPVDSTMTEKTLPSLFLDNTLYFDNESVAIVNATGESGVGSQVAHMLSTIGINVVSVTTAAKEEDGSILSSAHVSTYTMHRLSHVLHLTTTEDKNKATISDITLTLGKDSLSQLQ